MYEITRVSITCRIDPVHFSACFNYTYESYNALWSALISIVQAREAHIPERSSITAWDRAGGDFEGVALSGKLKFINRNYGPFFSFQLNPLKLEPSYRLSRQFGSDRFCVIGIPGLAPGNLPQYLKGHHALAREAITKWLVDTEHHILGRTWRAFYTKYKKKKSENSFEDIQFRVYFFAENGTGFRQERRFGETNTRILDRPQMSVKDMLEWFMPFKSNEEKPCLKFFARLALGRVPWIAILANANEIFRCE